MSCNDEKSLFFYLQCSNMQRRHALFWILKDFNWFNYISVRICQRLVSKYRHFPASMSLFSIVNKHDMFISWRNPEDFKGLKTFQRFGLHISIFRTMLTILRLFPAVQSIKSSGKYFILSFMSSWKFSIPIYN